MIPKPGEAGQRRKYCESISLFYTDVKNLEWNIRKPKLVRYHKDIKKEWRYYMYHNMGEPLKDYTKWKMPETKVHILYDSIYMQCLEQANWQRQKRRFVVTKGKEELGDTGFLFEMMECLLIRQRWWLTTLWISWS